MNIYDVRHLSIYRLSPGSEIRLAHAQCEYPPYNSRGTCATNHQWYHDGSRTGWSVFDDHDPFDIPHARDASAEDIGEIRYKCTFSFNDYNDRDLGSGNYTSGNGVCDRKMNAERTTEMIRPPPVLTRAALVDDLVAGDEVRISWNAVATGASAANGHAGLDGYTVQRRVPGLIDEWTELAAIRSVDKEDPAAEYTDSDPYAGPVEYRVTMDTLATRPELRDADGHAVWWLDGGLANSWIFSSAELGISSQIRWATLSRDIAARDWSELGPPQSTAVSTTAGGSYELTWNTPDTRGVAKYRLRKYAVEERNLTTGALLRTLEYSHDDTLAHRLDNPEDGIAYAFTVHGIRDGTDQPTPAVTLYWGTDAAPLVREVARRASGWVEIGWEPGPFNGYEAPPSTRRWHLRWREAGGSWVTLNTFGTADSRSTVVQLYPQDSVSGTASNYDIQMAAETAAGVGPFSDTLRIQNFAITAPAADGLLPPTNLMVNRTTDADSTDVWRLTWTAPANATAAGVTGYRVYQRRNGTGNFASAGDVAAGGLRFDVAVPEDTNGNPTSDTFEWYVVSLKSAEMSEPSNTVRGGVPAAPSRVRTTVNNERARVTVEWDPSPSTPAPRYIVEYSTDGVTWNAIGAPVSGTELEHTGLSMAATHQYRVIPVNQGGARGTSSNFARAEVNPVRKAVPDPVATVQVQAAGRERIHLTWEAPPSDGDSVIVRYWVQRSADGVDWDTLPTTLLNFLTTQYADTEELTAGTVRHYRVLAQNAIGVSSPSAVVQATTISAGTPTAPWRLVVAKRPLSSTLTLSWLPPASSGESAIRGYRIERAPRDSLIFEQVAETTNRNPVYDLTISNLETDTIYSYRVSAVNRLGVGDASAPNTHLSEIDYAAADINRDQSIDAADYAVVYHALAFPELVGNGQEGGSEAMRQQILSPLRGMVSDDDTGYRLLITRALAWAEEAMDKGANLNFDSKFAWDDAVFMYFTHSLRNDLGSGHQQSGDAGLRAAILMGYANPVSAVDTDLFLRGLLMQSQAITLD